MTTPPTTAPRLPGPGPGRTTRRRLLTLLGAVPLAGLAGGMGPFAGGGLLAQGAEVVDEARFDVRLGGARIGGHYLLVRREGDRLVAEQQGEATLRVGPVPVTRIRQASREVYRDGLLESLEIENESGYYEPRLRVITAEAQADSIALVDNQGRDYAIDRAAMPGSGWLKAALEAPVLISPRNGKPRQPTVRSHGREVVQLPGGERIETDHWSMSGDDMDARLWYELGSDRLLRMIMSFEGRDIEYLRLS